MKADQEKVDSANSGLAQVGVERIIFEHKKDGFCLGLISLSREGTLKTKTLKLRTLSGIIKINLLRLFCMPTLTLQLQMGIGTNKHNSELSQ